MKRTLATLAAGLLLLTPSRADEGMWLLPLIEKMNSDAIHNLGGRLSAEEIYSINNASIKDAIVQFGGGCTGEIISGSGLLVTNHHCGYSSIQMLSTPEHNYLEDGYWAMNRSEEIPVPGLTVTFLQSMTDITDLIASDKKGRKEKQLIDKAKKENPGCSASVVTFFNDNVKYLIVSKTYRDVRFVGAPPSSSGKFGGDTDNWMWPRHTCDFSMFRVYADKNNQPAAYSEDNIPFTPRQALNVSLRGVHEGDFAMIMGYPGRTQRFQTAAQLENMMELNDIRIAARTVRQDIMWDARMADPVVNLQYASKYSSSSNGWKKWQGMKEAFAKLNIIGRELEKEKQFTEWVSADEARTKSYGAALGQIEAAVEQSAGASKAAVLLQESVGRIELLGFAGAFELASIKADEIPSAVRRVSAAFKDYNVALDRKEAVALINFYRDRVADGDAFTIEGQDIRTIDVEAYVEDIFAHTRFTTEEGLATIKTKEDITSDPAFRLYQSVAGKLLEFTPSVQSGQHVIAEANKAFTAGLLEWKKDEAHYPDANFTCRLTYGTVKGYSPKDAVEFKYYTTLKGVMEKEDPNNYEFIVPERLKEIYNTKDYGQYANENGEIVTCFLTNLDITGGNSGSPVLDADGNLIGLAFDGNWEAMSSDVMFEPDLQRCICVDIRYVLLMMDKFGGAGYLLDEMNIIR